MDTSKFIFKKICFKISKQDATDSFLSAEKRLTIVLYKLPSIGKNKKPVTT